MALQHPEWFNGSPLLHWKIRYTSPALQATGFTEGQVTRIHLIGVQTSETSCLREHSFTPRDIFRGHLWTMNRWHVDSMHFFVHHLLHLDLSSVDKRALSLAANIRWPRTAFLIGAHPHQWLGYPSIASCKYTLANIWRPSTYTPQWTSGGGSKPSCQTKSTSNVGEHIAATYSTHTLTVLSQSTQSFLVKVQQDYHLFQARKIREG